MRPFTFLAGIQSVMDGAALAAEARRAEAMGFAAVVVPDHLIEQLSPIPALATIAAATEHLGITTTWPRSWSGLPGRRPGQIRGTRTT